MSHKGQRGNAGGLYMAEIRPSKYNNYGIDVGYGFQERSQAYCIEKMEENMEYKRRNAQ
jgi:hypothetical protein